VKNPALLSGSEVIEMYKITPHDLFSLIKEQGLRPCSKNGERFENPLDAKIEFRKCVIERLKELLDKRHFIDRLMRDWNVREKITSLHKDIPSIEFAKNEDPKREWRFMPWSVFSSDYAVHELLGYFFIGKDVVELLGPSSEFEKAEAQDKDAPSEKESQTEPSEASGEKGPISIIVSNQQHGLTGYGHQINTPNKQYAENMTPEEVRRQGLQVDKEKHSADKIAAAIYGMELCVALEKDIQMTKSEFESSINSKFPKLPYTYITEIWNEIKDSKYGNCLKGPGARRKTQNKDDE